MRRQWRYFIAAAVKDYPVNGKQVYIIGAAHLEERSGPEPPARDAVTRARLENGEKAREVVTVLQAASLYSTFSHSISCSFVLDIEAALPNQAIDSLGLPYTSRGLCSERVSVLAVRQVSYRCVILLVPGQADVYIVVSSWRCWRKEGDERSR